MSLKKAYLYLVSVISLVIWVIGAIMLFNLALKSWVFSKADQNYYYSMPCPAFVEGKTKDCDQAQIDQQRKMDAENRSAQKQRDAAQALAMILVAAPVWWGHWRLAKKEI